MKMKIFLLIFFLLCSLNLVFKGNQYIEAQENPIQIVASISPLADLVTQVGSERVSVHLLVPNGVSPHTFDPKPSDIKKLEQADLFFIVGLGLEMFAYDMAQAVRNNLELLELGKKIEVLDDPEENDHEHQFGNPHVWVSLRNLSILAESVAEAIIKVDPDNKEIYLKNAQSYKEQCQQLDRWFGEKVKNLKTRHFIAQHSAWSYLARDYNLVQIGVIEEKPGEEPSPKKIKSLIDDLKISENPVIFAEPQLNQKTAQILSQETGVKVIILDPLGSYPNVPFLETMKDNLEKIIEAMQ
ncbi:MAG: zinc ABC transporter substrate-binding protein [Candidatus Atribacteria bacterium]|nr:zinc ABC transporter substrate-binding protein [Candidatus Atribacteria bacterium]